MSYQLTIIEGNLTRDAEIRQVGQSVVAKIDVAVGSSYTKRDGTQVNETEYFNNIELWDKPGVLQYLVKGQSVLVQMVQKTESYNDQQGQPRKAVKFRAQVVQLCGSPNRQQQQGTQQAPPAPPQYQHAPQYQAPPQAPQHPPQPQYHQAPPAPPQQQYPQPQPPAPPQYPQPGQPGNQQYPPMNSPAYTDPQNDDLPEGF